jgi:hypothetical protein
MKRKPIALTLIVTLLCLAANLAPAGGADAGVLESATGSGQFVTDTGFFRTFAFTAVKYEDGSVRGEAEVRNPDMGTLRHVQIDCLSIRGNLAIASGFFTSAEDPSLIGAPAIFAVQDNGQGANAPPDQVSRGVYANQKLTCETAPTSLALSVLVPIDAGNVQVR